MKDSYSLRRHLDIRALEAGMVGGDQTSSKSSLPSLQAVIVAIAGALLLSVAYRTLFGDKEPEEALGEVPEEDQAKELPKEPKPAPEIPKLEPVKKIEGDLSWVDRVKKMFELPKEEKLPDPSATPSKPASPLANAPASKAKPLGEGYRGKFKFPDSVKNAEALASYGSYTQSEANQLVSLKTNRVNTSASAGFSKQTEDKVRNRAEAYGLDPDQMVKIVAMESGGNPNAISSTGAIGIFQFTGDTASRMGLTDRFDEDANIEAGMQLAKANQKVLSNYGMDSTPISLYLVHQLGPKAAKEILEAADSKKPTPISSLSKSTRSAVSKNAGGKSAKTAKEYVDATQEKLNTKYSIAVGSRPTSESSPPVQSSTTNQPASIPKVTLPPQAMSGKVAQMQAMPAVPEAPPSPSSSQQASYQPSASGSSEHPPQGVFTGPGGLLVGTA